MNRAARVVPDVASFSVDDGFWYSVPEHLRHDLDVGSIVRVPLSGRRVRGWVVETADSREGRLKEVAGISGVMPVFDQDMLKSLRWAANHYVSPLSGLLARATPPNLPRSTPETFDIANDAGPTHAIGAVVERSAARSNMPVTALVAAWQNLEWLHALGPVLASGASVLVVAASVAEVDRISSSARVRWGAAVVSVDGQDDASDTTAWEAAQVPARLVIGTPRTATWRVRELALVIVLEESRRAMKDRQTPTLHVRDVIRTRSRLEGFNLVFFGPTPGVEIMSTGAEIVKGGKRAWPHVEVVDRSDDAPGSGYLSERTLAAIRGAVQAGRKTFVFTHRRAGYASMRCVECRALRSCANCGTRMGRVERCPRCDAEAAACRRCGSTEFEEMGTIPDRLIAEVNKKLGATTAVAHPGDSPVTVGTERDLAAMSGVDLAVAADVDGMLMGIGYRTSEEALRQLARLALTVGDGSGSRLIIQTSRPDSLLVTTMRRGDPIPYLERVLVERAREESPPSTEMVVLEVRGEVPGSVSADLGSLDAGALVLGPMAIEEGERWLLTGNLGKTRLELRKIVGRWRDKGATVRVDVDPIDV